MSLHHGLTDSRDNHLTCFTDVLYSSMVPGILPSQLEILSEPNFETLSDWMRIHMHTATV